MNGMMEASGMKRLRRRGFTLAEVVIVVVILAIIVAVAAPAFVGSLNRFRMNEAASNLLFLMRYTRQKAVVVQERRRIILDIDHNKYWMEEYIRDRHGRIDPDKTLHKQQMYLPEQHRIRAIYKPKTEETFTSGEVSVDFYPDGTCEGAYVLIERPASENSEGAETGIKVEPYNSNPKYMSTEEMDEYFAGY